MAVLAPQKLRKPEDTVMSQEQQDAAELRLELLQIAADYAARVHHLANHPEDRVTKTLLINGVPARLLSSL